MTVETRTLVIGECGSCHDGLLSQAMRLIALVAEAGADVAKFQYWSSADRMVARRNAPEYREVYARYAMPRVWLPVLRRRCDELGIRFGCTTYLPEDVWAVAEHCDIMKVASFEANDWELLVAHRAPLAAGKRVIVSMGMAAADDTLDRAFLDCEPAPGSRGGLSRLHCTSAYPAQASELNLRKLWAIGWASARNGFSDHSDPSADWTGALAVAAMATIVERHVRLGDTADTNPDYPHAMSPSGFVRYVRNIRFAEMALGDRAAGPTPGEEAMLKYRVVQP